MLFLCMLWWWWWCSFGVVFRWKTKKWGKLRLPNTFLYCVLIEKYRHHCHSLPAHSSPISDYSFLIYFFLNLLSPRVFVCCLCLLSYVENRISNPDKQQLNKNFRLKPISSVFIICFWLKNKREREREENYYWVSERILILIENL